MANDLTKIEMVSRILEMLYPNNDKHHPYMMAEAFCKRHSKFGPFALEIAFYAWDNDLNISELFLSDSSIHKDLHSIYSRYKDVCILVGVPVWDVYSLHEWG